MDYTISFTHGFKRIFGIFTSYSGLSNGLLPLMFSIIPFIISLKLNNIYTYKFSKIEIIIPLSMLFFTMGEELSKQADTLYTHFHYGCLFSLNKLYIYLKI